MVSKKRILTWLVPLCLLGVVIGYVGLAWPTDIARTGDVPLLLIGDWSSTGYFEVRIDSRATDHLLLSQTPVPPKSHSNVYRYNTTTGSWAKAEDLAWNASDAPISTSADHGHIKAPPFLVRQENGLRFGDRSLRTCGSTMLRYHISPKISLIAAISVDGGRRPSVQFFPMGSRGGGYAGQHYLEFFEFPSLQRRGEPIRLFGEEFGLPCWSADEQYLIIPHTDFRNVCIVPVPSTNGETK